MSSNEAWISTEAEEDLPQGKVNKLKGMAMEAAVEELTDKVEGSEQSLGRILEEAQEILKDIYNVKKMFRLREDGSQTTYRRQMSEIDSNIRLALDKSEIHSDNINILAPENTNKAYFGYKKCGGCGYTYPEYFCKRCGGAVFEDRFFILKKIKDFNQKQEEREKKDLTNSVTGRSSSDIVSVGGDDRIDSFQVKVDQIKECKWNAEDKFGRNEFCNCDVTKKEEHYVSKNNYRKCKCGGHYSKVQTEFSTNQFNYVDRNLDAEQAVDFLKENDYIAKSSFKDKIKGKRLDSWRYNGERVEIFESKNKEKTGLNYSNIAQVFYYIKAMRKAGLDTTKDARIVYNGRFPESLLKSIRFFEEEYGYSLEAISLEEWCREKGTYIETIEIGKDIQGTQYSENGDYNVNVMFSDSYIENPSILINTAEER